MAWKEINQSPMWKPTDEGDEIEGTLIKVDTNIGKNNSNIYHLDTNDGVIGMWGSVVLDSRLSQVPLGARVKIVFQGLGEKKGGHNAPKLFKIYVDATFEDVPRDERGNPISERDDQGRPISSQEVPG